MYKKALESEGCQAVHLTSIEEDFECDTYLEGFDQVQLHAQCLEALILVSLIKALCPPRGRT